MISPDETQTRFEPVHDDRRRMPRILLRCPGRATTASGDVVDVIVRDLSPDGLQLRCDRVAALAIHPGGRAINEREKAPYVQVDFEVPLREGPVEVRVLARLVFFSLIAPHVIAIGVRFKSTSKDDERRLRQFYKEALEPAPEVDEAEAERRPRNQIKGAGDRLVIKRRRKG